MAFSLSRTNSAWYANTRKSRIAFVYVLSFVEVRGFPIVREAPPDRLRLLDCRRMNSAVRAVRAQNRVVVRVLDPEGPLGKRPEWVERAPATIVLIVERVEQPARSAPGIFSCRSLDERRVRFVAHGVSLPARAVFGLNVLQFVQREFGAKALSLSRHPEFVRFTHFIGHCFTFQVHFRQQVVGIFT